MTPTAGIIFAFVALVSWGFGDFLIQRMSRIGGSVQAMFLIGITGAVGLFPFVENGFAALHASDFVLLLALCGIALIAAFTDFEALRKGKIAVIEPVVAFELPFTVLLGAVIGRESISMAQLPLIALVFLGILLAISPDPRGIGQSRMESGVLLASGAAVGLAFTNYFVGIASRTVSPLMAIWFTHAALASVCGIYLLVSGKIGGLARSMRSSPKTIIGQSVFDNAGWIAFAYASTALPISIAATISECFVVLAILLGIIINRERLRPHQYAGIVFAIGGVLALSALSS